MSTSASFNETRLPAQRQARITLKLNLRDGPGVLHRHLGRLEPGDLLPVDRVADGEPFLGRGMWFGVAGVQMYFWAEGAQLEDAAPAAPPPPPAPGVEAPKVKRRNQGQTIMPFNVTELRDVFGGFGTVPHATMKGFVTITPNDWVQQNIVPFQHQVLSDIGVGGTRLHRLAAQHLKGVFDDILARNLAHHVESFDGGWVARHIGQNTSKPLSSHTWGVAIDLNARWNRQGDQPARFGQPGHLEPLVEIFNAHGFAWGGHFSGSGIDGMHFELARFNP